MIRPQPTALARRVAPGAWPAAQGRRFRDRAGEVMVDQSGTAVVSDTAAPVYVDKRPHNLSLAVEKNQPNHWANAK